VCSDVLLAKVGWRVGIEVSGIIGCGVLCGGCEGVCAEVSGVIG